MADGSLPQVIEAHAEDAASLWIQRQVAVTAPNVTPELLARQDERLEAHLDGLRIAGTDGQRVAWENFDAAPEPGEAFVLAHLAFGAEAGDAGVVLNALEYDPTLLRPMIGALGWLPPNRLRGKILPMFEDERPIVRALALGACSAHRVDPGERLANMFDDVPVVRARAFRLAGELGLTQLLGHLGATRADNDGPCKFYRVWSGARLGERSQCPHDLGGIATSESRFRSEALDMLMQVIDPAAGRDWLVNFAGAPDGQRMVVRGAGHLGTVEMAEWLITQMDKPPLARAAGAAFAQITGCDIDDLNLDGPLLPGGDAGPNDDPEDENIELDPDEDLPWPDQKKISAWWSEASAAFDPAQRYFLGEVRSIEAAVRTLAVGYQPQRRIAALQLAVARLDEVMLNCSAPPKRQVSIPFAPAA